MQKVNVDRTVKLIANNIQNGILPLTDPTLRMLKQKHLKSASTTEEILLLIKLEILIKSNAKMQMQFAKPQIRVTRHNQVYFSSSSVLNDTTVKLSYDKP